MFYFCSTGGWYRTIVEQTNRERLGAPQSPNPINPLSPITPYPPFSILPYPIHTICLFHPIIIYFYFV